MPGSVQGSLCGRLRGPYGVPGLNPGPLLTRQNVLPTVQPLGPSYKIFFKIRVKTKSPDYLTVQ